MESKWKSFFFSLLSGLGMHKQFEKMQSTEEVSSQIQQQAPQWQQDTSKPTHNAFSSPGTQKSYREQLIPAFPKYLATTHQKKNKSFPSEPVLTFILQSSQLPSISTQWLSGLDALPITALSDRHLTSVEI